MFRQFQSLPTVPKIIIEIYETNNYQFAYGISDGTGNFVYIFKTGFLEIITVQDTI